MRKYDELINEAIYRLENEDDLFCDCIDELDRWDGFADGYKCFPMWELDELCGDMKLSDFLNEITDDFNHKDEFFFWSIYGIESTDDKTDLYRTNTEAGEVLDNLINNYSHIELSYIDSEFDELLDEIVNYDDECESEAV